MQVKLMCDLHDKKEVYEVHQWVDEDGQKCFECLICEAEAILRDYSEDYYPQT